MPIVRGIEVMTGTGKLFSTGAVVVHADTAVSVMPMAAKFCMY
jgi:hypothetical protein